jgi:hypothetical protein
MGILLMIPRVSKEHQKGGISNGRSPVCLFFTPVGRLFGFHSAERHTNSIADRRYHNPQARRACQT